MPEFCLFRLLERYTVGGVENEVKAVRDTMQMVRVDTGQVPAVVCKSGSLSTGPLEAMVAETRACKFEALEFFVSWQGVLTIAYSGIPDSLLELKNAIETHYPGLLKENPGSKWPKTSIACLRNNQRLSMPNLEKLREICSEESPNLARTSSPVEVDKLSVVLFANFCLEKTFMVTDIPLTAPADVRGPTPEQRGNVRTVLDEFKEENLHNYYFHASKDGNRSAHYRGYKGGTTLVHFLSNVPKALSRFRARVEEELPNMYDWFSEETFHITIRAIL